MNKTIFSNTLWACILSLIFIGCDKEEDKDEQPAISGKTMTMSVDIELSERDDLLLLAKDSVPEIVLTFSEPIDDNSIQKGIQMKAFTRGASDPQVLSPEITSANNEKKILHLKIPENINVDSHTLFQLNITTDLISTNGASLEKEVSGIFYVGGKGCFDSGLTESPQPQKAIVIVSDIHMGDQRSQDRGYGWFKDNKQLFVEFLNYLIENARLLDKLVIAGDFMDEWVSPMNTETLADNSGNKISQQKFVGQIIAANQDIVDKLKELQRHDVEIVYVPGNHDMLVTANDFEHYFGKGVITQARDMPGLGRYEPSEDIIIEHGHRYDYFNAPAPLSNKGIDQVNDNSILPPGFFVSKIASSSDLETRNLRQSKAGFSDLTSGYAEDKQNWATLALAWPLILSTKPVNEGISGKYIKTGIDGFTREYVIEDVSDWYVTDDPEKCRKPLLYQTSFETQEWTNRLKANGVLNSDQVTFETALLAGVINSTYKSLAQSQYIEGTDMPKRIIVFGHTHEATITNIGNSVYANSGTWVDDKWAPKMPKRTFVVIQDYQGVNKKGTKEISLFSFENKDQIVKINNRYCLRYQ